MPKPKEIQNLIYSLDGNSGQYMIKVKRYGIGSFYTGPYHNKKSMESDLVKLKKIYTPYTKCKFTMMDAEK